MSDVIFLESLARLAHEPTCLVAVEQDLACVDI